jgi:hypothetical protein
VSSLEAVLIGLAASVVAGTIAGLWAVFARREWGLLAGTHAHNDYRQRRPLADALRQGYVSVEADIWPVDGELLVAHDFADVEKGRTLRRLYLEPLARRVEALGAVHRGATEPFQLLIEIKADPQTAYELLDAELREYASMLTTYEDGRVQPGAVSVVVTGMCPREVLAGQPLRYAACDGTLGDVGGGTPASLVPLCSDKLAWRFTWRGRGPMPAHERALLRRLVAQAHTEGRRVRFWGVPTGPVWVQLAIWVELHEAGVDYLSADRLGLLAVFLRLRALRGAPRGVLR